ncbi:heme lyase CcmF/NrfE family subunit [Aestuariivirga sp. YIM B02566]|uniref:Heme lyase CcmF/NrfE family subunit n=1 Tax=Taklimakanibacter albus TaxID=2800327 RepID=A0ACC5RBK7_9HYPH|nr:heme lyase CcmF/NrfE family subunit [Aestuariivirga sp. YIM B02566]MBK1869974.1 heme lyase CcmF/NrfE family subunit [Aestuariivirga sp. YIM B02566]
MIAETGHFALILALVTALAQCFVPLYGAHRGDRALMNVAAPAALAQFSLIVIAFFALMHAYVTSDFSLANVWENSHSAKPLLYKISGVWGNHEGSMVLWVLILALFGAGVALFGGNLPLELKSRVLAVQGSIGVAFLLFILFTSNPFLRLDPVPIEGNGLNPLLQDPALAFHPPFLYAGYVGLSVSFSFAIAALIDGKVDAAWARWVRPWTLAAWMFLTIGIAMGSWWAYYELGWGGFWFWDPVENASFMPWLVAAALLHSAVVVEKRNALKIWTILLAILAFSLSLVGAFLVRSGVLTSVHAFAVDPARGVFILLILCVFIGGALALFAWRAPVLKAGGLFTPMSREGGLVVNNLLLCTACASVFIGTLYPLALETLTGEKISVGPPYFNLTFGLIMLPLLLLVPVGPLLTWKRAQAWPVIQRLWAAALGTLAVVILLLVVLHRGPWLTPFGVGLGLWLVLGALVELSERIALFRTPWAMSWSRLKGLPRSALGMTLAHAGVGLAIIGIFAVTTWREEHIVAMKPGDKLTVGGYEVTYIGEAPMTGPNYTGDAGRFRVMSGNREVTVLASEKRRFRPGNQETTEVGLLQAWSGDLYAVMGDRMNDGARAVRIYFNPLISLIWIGTFIMFLGGFVSLTDRRFRVGAPKTARKLHAVPAE